MSTILPRDLRDFSLGSAGFLSQSQLVRCNAVAAQLKPECERCRTLPVAPDKDRSHFAVWPLLANLRIAPDNPLGRLPRARTL
jgi:hypothetical protein